MAIITPALLLALNTGFKKSFQDALDTAESQYLRIATTVPSTTSSETYGWLGQFPTFREWVGDRVLKDMAAHGYSIVNRKFESSVTVPRDAIEDDSCGIYMPLFSEMGRAAKVHPDELIFGLIKKGSVELCYDGQPFFDADHPVYSEVDGTGVAVSVSNVTAGAGPAWYLLDVSRALKPLIFQKRRDYNMQAMIRLDDESVFMRDEFRYGVDARVNVGFGFWQMAHKSQATLDADNYAAARCAMLERKADGGRPLAIKPGLLLVPPALEGRARALIEKDKDAGNEWYKSAEVLVCPWLT